MYYILYFLYIGMVCLQLNYLLVGVKFMFVTISVLLGSLNAYLSVIEAIYTIVSVNACISVSTRIVLITLTEQISFCELETVFHIISSPFFKYIFEKRNFLF